MLSHDGKIEANHQPQYTLPKAQNIAHGKRVGVADDTTKPLGFTEDKI